MKKRIELHQSQKDSAFSPVLFLWKNTGVVNIFKTCQKSTKSRDDSCYYEISLERSVNSEAATGGVLQEKVFLKISQISQVNCVGVSFDRNSHWRCSVEKVFLKFFQISQQNSCVGVSLIKFELKRFPVKFAKFLRTPILKNICKQLLL